MRIVVVQILGMAFGSTMKLLSKPSVFTVGALLLFTSLVTAATGSDGIVDGPVERFQETPVPETPVGADEGESGQEPAPPTEVPEAPGEGEEPTAPAAPIEGGTQDGGTGDDGGGDFPLWGWIVIAAGAVLVILGLVAWARRGRSAALARQSDWRDRALDAYGGAVAIHDAVAADLTAGGLVGTDAEDAKRRWEGAERRINDLAAELHALEARAPDDPDDPSARAIRDLLATLGTLRSAVQSHLFVRTGDGASQLTDEKLAESESLVRRRLSEFDASLRALKAVI